MILIKPTPGAHVRDPETKKLLTDEGVKVEKIDTYWHRRLQEKVAFIADEKLQVAFESKQLVTEPAKNKKQGV